MSLDLIHEVFQIHHFVKFLYKIYTLLKHVSIKTSKKRKDTNPLRKLIEIIYGSMGFFPRLVTLYPIFSPPPYIIINFDRLRKLFHGCFIYFYFMSDLIFIHTHDAVYTHVTTTDMSNKYNIH